MLSWIQKRIQRERLKADAQLVKRLTEDYGFDVFLKDRFGICYQVEPQFNLRHLLNHKTYFDGDIAEILKKLSTKGPFKLALDVGANKGLTSSLLGQFVDQVIAFEPDENNIKKIEQTLFLNKRKNVEVISKAVSDKEGELPLFIGLSDAHHSLGEAHTGAKQGRSVPVVTLDGFCRDRKINHVDILKVDVEGFEANVFNGAQELLANKKVDHIIFEISLGLMERLKFDPAEPLRILEKNGYGIYEVNGRRVRPDEILQFGGQDFLAQPL